MIDVSFKRHIQRNPIESHIFGNFQNDRSIADVPAFGKKRPKNSFMVGIILSVFFSEFTTLHRLAGIAHQRLWAKPNAHLLAALIKLPE